MTIGLLKTPRLATVAQTILGMTYRELCEFAGEVGGDADKAVEWAETYTAPQEGTGNG